MGELFLARSMAKAGKSSHPSTTTQLASRGWEQRRHSPPWRKFEVLQPCMLQNHSERRRSPGSRLFVGRPEVAWPRRFGKAAAVAAIKRRSHSEPPKVVLLALAASPDLCFF